MFKRVITSRGWPSQGMTTKKWKRIPYTRVRISDLIATQDGVYLHALLPDHISQYSNDPLPHVVRWQGELFVEDGHHRIVRWLLEGTEWALVRILEIEEDK
jgi:hypothetical protein